MELMGWLGDGLPENHPFRAVTAMPAVETRPEVWILGSSDYGAQVAAYFGLPYCFAHFITDGRGGEEAMALYREGFRPHPGTHGLQIVGRELHGDDEPVGGRHDLHQGLAGADDLTDRVDLEALDHALDRRAHLVPPEHVLRDDELFPELADLLPRLEQLRRDGLLELLLELRDLQPGLADGVLGLRGLRHRAPDHALEA